MAGLTQLNQFRSYSGTVDATGRLVITVSSQNAIVNWLVTQVSAYMPTAPSGSQCQVNVNGAFMTYLISSGDAAGQGPPILLHPGDAIQVVWTGCTPGDVGTVLSIYDQTGFD